MTDTPAPIGFILTFVAGYCGSVGCKVGLYEQFVRSIDGLAVDPDNGLGYLEVTTYVGCRDAVYLDRLTAVRPAQRDAVGNYC